MEWVLGLGLVIAAIAWLRRPRDTTPIIRRTAPPQRSARSSAAPRFDSTTNAPSQREAQAGDAMWHRPGSPTAVGNLPFTEGSIYVGSGLAALNGQSVEPALIDPRLKVDQRLVDRGGVGLDYWPSYSKDPARVPSRLSGMARWWAVGSEHAHRLRVPVLLRPRATGPRRLEIPPTSGGRDAVDTQ